jgi:HD-GYP domain-containing protein (c-di-GMP phosphodiesterase class II)
MAAAAIRACDGATGSHSDDVVHLCAAIADVLEIHGTERSELLAAAQLHDIGKIGLPKEVLLKPGSLDEGEWALIRQHTVTGAKMVESVPELSGIAPAVRHSHERWDGRGYPDGLAGEEIPLASRIGFCADAFHAIRSDRPYRRARPAAVALDEVRRNAGSQFDPQVADALAESARQVRDAGSDEAGTVRSQRLVALLT